MKSSGFDEKQAESVVETINKAVNETVATKADLALLGADLAILGADLKVQGAKIEVLTKTVEGIQENIEKTMDTKMAKLETRMMRMMWLQLMAMLGMFVTMVVALT